MRRTPLLLAALALPFALAAPATASGCPLLTDPAGDGSLAISPLLSSPDLDILSADIASGASTVVVALRLASFDRTAVTARGTSWRVFWHIAGNPYSVSMIHNADGSFYPGKTGGLTTTAGITLTADASTATLALVVPRSSVPDLATPGGTFDSIAASSAASLVAVTSNGDAATTASTYVDQTAGCVPAS